MKSLLGSSLLSSSSSSPAPPSAGELYVAGGGEVLQQQQHVERHFGSREVVRDVVMGLSDGLTVPFALAAGLSSSPSSSPSLVVTAGLAELAAGAIAMGLGGYLAAKSEMDHYFHERQREEKEVQITPDDEAEEVAKILENFGLKPNESKTMVDALRERPNDWVDFMMRDFFSNSINTKRFELGLEKPDPRRALKSAITIALSYVMGGLFPLLPYMAIPNVSTALVVSTTITLFALVLFGYVKGRIVGTNPYTSALQTVLVGTLASSVAFAIAKAIQGY